MRWAERLIAWLVAAGLIAALLALPLPAAEGNEVGEGTLLADLDPLLATPAATLTQRPAQPVDATVQAPPTAIPSPTPAALMSTPAPPPTWTPTATPLPAPTATPCPTLTPSPTPEPERWIEVVLSTQTLNAYEGDRLVRSWKVSTGLPRTPTPTGDFHIWVKLRYDDMEGPGYYLPNVPYVMYFYGGYGIHGVYWHANFGHPMSHGCVNMPTDGAAWLFEWASVGTLVRIRP